ncbi:hypothetical protein AB840_00245 [Megasphaera cerevisiae DSM 20462]|jgi:DNA-binding MarR family transcriptional regulator|uniref:HTH marR-type domain-containing protein n=1 Tax=Megasphaera cerevisiae DSM 20462 TaxID=1122219 RepID=A0A0J6X006_9FIRM|nr:MarR family transcriptional regulator [Megasphaera cerevisiae]KMO87853.1 hypothetical protein AB840_00245 [Megasphaera cerevisiae DSM 20462]MCI1750144.1 MarR family transcriptional regulator [Megasphaera cerevisiae]OKY54359.1 hypothetical protein BSR42_02645 [Megasphaera cerevisiae]SJZ41949.1 DNA-binding transcriptional regulator, MarR family [Megasphaera cerevisiae DSM 20462]
MDYSRIGFNFGMLNRRSQAYISHACQPWNIRYSEYVILMELYIRDGCSQDELARAMTTDKGLVARNIKTLEKKGLIRREQDEKDRRFKYIYLTDSAFSLHEALLDVLKKWILCITEGMDRILIEQTIQGLQIAAANASKINIENTKPDEEA